MGENSDNSGISHVKLVFLILQKLILKVQEKTLS